MADEEQARKERAEQLRRQIEELQTGQDGQDGDEDEASGAKKPGESEKEYLERLEKRMRAHGQRNPGEA